MKMTYDVIKAFKDKTNNNVIYRQGDAYTCDDDKRINMLIERGFLKDNTANHDHDILLQAAAKVIEETQKGSYDFDELLKREQDGKNRKTVVDHFIKQLGEEDGSTKS